MLDLNAIEKSEVQWPKRGRKPKPLPESLVSALQAAYTNGDIASLKMNRTDQTRFSNLLTAAGRKLNMRIERHIEDIDDDTIIFHFRPRAKANGSHSGV